MISSQVRIMSTETFVTLIIGDVETVESFADIYSEVFRESVEMGVKEHGLVRIEPDSDCTRNAGKGIIAIKIHARNAGNHFTTSVVGHGLSCPSGVTNNGVRIEAQPFRGKITIGDIIAKQFLAVCTLDTVQNVRNLWDIDNFKFIDLGTPWEDRYTISVDANGVDIRSSASQD